MGGIFGGGDPYQQQQQQMPVDQTGYPMVTADWQPPAAGSDYYNVGGGQGGGYPTGAFDSSAYGGDYGGGGDSGGGGILNWLGSEKGQRAMQQLGGWSAGMLQGSAPSLQPRNFSTGLGAGMAGMQQAGSQYYTDALRRAQAQEAQAKVADLQTWSKVMQGAAGNATGLPPGYMPGGMPGSGTSTPAVAPAPASAGGSGGSGRGGWGPLAQPAIGALTAAGVSTAGQQAIMGHGLAEGGFNVPWNVGDSGNSFGHWQFNNRGELPGYLDWAQGRGNPQDTALQAQYVAKRMEEIHPGFSKVTDPAQAMSMVADFERYTGYRTDKRLGFLADAQKAMGGGQLEERQPIPPGPGGGRLADTAFQMPPNMAAGLGGPAPATGILPQAAAAGPMPTITQPQPNTTLASGLRPPAPIITTPQTTAAVPAEQAATTGAGQPSDRPAAAPRGKALAVGDSIALQFVKKGGLDGKTADDPTDLGADAAASRNPQQVLDFINTALKYDPNYFRGKNVVLSTGVSNDPTGSMIDRVPQQLALLKQAGANVTVVGVGNKPGKEQGTDYTDLRPYNPVLQRLANSAGAGFTGPLPGVIHPPADYYGKAVAKLAGAPRGEGSGAGGIPASQLSTGAFTPGAGQPDTPAPVVGASAAPAPPPSGTQPAPVPSPPAPAGTLVQGGALPPAAPPAGAPGGLVRGTAAGMPTPPPQPLPAAPAPSPAAAAGPPGPPPPPTPGAIAGGAPNAMPGSIAPPPVAAPPAPLPLPNLGQVQMPGAGGLPPYDVEAARRAQILSIAGAATGHQVPAYLAEQAGLPNKAVEQSWARQAQLYGAQLQAAQAQWNAATDLQKQQIAHAQGMETEQYKSELGIRAKRFEQGIMLGPDGQIIQQPGYAQATGAIAGATAAAQEDEKAKHQMITAPIVQPNGSILDTQMTQYDFNQRTQKQAGRPPQAGDIVGKPSAALEPGYEYRTGPGGVVTAQPIANTPAAQKAQDLARSQAIADRQLQVSRDAVMISANRLEDLVNKSTLPTTGIIGTKLAPYYQPSKDVEALIQTIQSRTTMDQLQAARAGSATGASGFGNLTETEGEKLQSSIANLKQSQSKEQFLQNLQVVKQEYINLVHGPGAYKQMSDAGVLQTPKTQPPVGARTATGPDGPMYEYAPGKWRKM